MFHVQPTSSLPCMSQSVIEEGCWEYNSRPYSAYFFLAVMALADAAEERLRTVARRVCPRHLRDVQRCESCLPRCHISAIRSSLAFCSLPHFVSAI